MRVLVTGGCGFIGSNFVRQLLESRGSGVTVVNLDKMTYAANPANLADVEHLPNYRFIRVAVGKFGLPLPAVSSRCGNTNLASKAGGQAEIQTN